MTTCIYKTESIIYSQEPDKQIRMSNHKVNESRSHLQTYERRCCHHLCFHHPGSSHIYLDQLDFQHPTKSTCHLEIIQREMFSLKENKFLLFRKDQLHQKIGLFLTVRNVSQSWRSFKLKIPGFDLLHLMYPSHGSVPKGSNSCMIKLFSSLLSIQTKDASYKISVDIKVILSPLNCSQKNFKIINLHIFRKQLCLPG